MSEPHPQNPLDDLILTRLEQGGSLRARDLAKALKSKKQQINASLYRLLRQNRVQKHIINEKGSVVWALTILVQDPQGPNLFSKPKTKHDSVPDSDLQDKAGRRDPEGGPCLVLLDMGTCPKMYPAAFGIRGPDTKKTLILFNPQGNNPNPSWFIDYGDIPDLDCLIEVPCPLFVNCFYVPLVLSMYLGQLASSLKSPRKGPPFSLILITEDPDLVKTFHLAFPKVPEGVRDLEVLARV